MNIREMGRIARDLLAQEQGASVMGATSLGLFLRLSSGWVVFISPKAFRGPLTLNLQRGSAELKHFPAGSPAHIYLGRIAFPPYNLVINTWQSKTWEAPPIVAGISPLPPGPRKARLVDIAQQVLAGKKPSLLGSFLPVVLGLESESNADGNLFSPLVQDLGRSLEGSDIPTMVEAIDAFLGLGTGLTPSGDDLVLGFLLALNRWGHVLAPSLKVKALNQALLPHAYRKTTLLAANLIECASRGQADERLILALDGILTGVPDVATCAAHLAGWGNSSGLDTLVGIALAADAQAHN